MRLYETGMKFCSTLAPTSDSCIDLINEMSKSIGAVNIYDIYKPCLNNFPSNAVPISRAKYICLANYKAYLRCVLSP